MLRYVRAGEGPTVVLQHGFLGGPALWLPLMNRLSRSFDVLVPELPGFAESASLPYRRSIPDLSADVVALLDGLGIDRASIVGHSMGGMIALETALSHPDQVSGLVLIGTAAVGASKHRFESHEASAERFQREGAAAAAEFVVSSWFRAGKSSPYYAVCREIALRASGPACAAAMLAIASWSALDRLGHLRVPALILSGDNDRSRHPDEAVALWRGIAGSSLCIIPEAAHCVHLERAELVNEIVAGFLAEIG